MRITQLILAALLFGAPSLTSFAADGATSVRAISFVASHDRGQTDARLAPYEPILRSNLRFESFRYVGESSASVSPGGTANLTVQNIGRIELKGEGPGNVSVRRGGTVVTVSPNHPTVFMGGSGGRGETSGVIVLAQ
jgi:hypothetical protein